MSPAPQPGTSRYSKIMSKQIGEDMIDLRLNPLAKCLKAGVTIDLLEDNTERYLEKVILTAEGYILKPGEILFCSTLEKIRITSRQHMGLILGRPTIATYGLSVTLNQSKVPIDLPWNFPLQLCNNTQRDIKIYPFVTIVQILLIEYPYGDLGAYKRGGKYKNQELAEQYPGIIGDERSDLQYPLDKWKKIPSDYDFEKNTQEVNEKIREGVKRYKIPTVRWLNYVLEWLIPLSTPGSFLIACAASIISLSS